MEQDQSGISGLEPAAAGAQDLRFEDVYRDYADYVYNLAFRLTGRASDADDLMQDSFLRVYRYLAGYAGGSLKAWLRRIVLNVFLTKCRSANQAHVSLEVAEGEPHAHQVDLALTDISGDPAWCLEQVSLDDRLQLSLNAIPAEFRVTLVLRELEDLTYEQIAAQLGVPIGTVRSRLARARALLREQLGGAGAA